MCDKYFKMAFDIGKKKKLPKKEKEKFQEIIKLYKTYIKNS